jgi:hypothetical protein
LSSDTNPHHKLTFKADHLPYFWLNTLHIRHATPLLIKDIHICAHRIDDRNRFGSENLQSSRLPLQFHSTHFLPVWYTKRSYMSIDGFCDISCAAIALRHASLLTLDLFQLRTHSHQTVISANLKSSTLPNIHASISASASTSLLGTAVFASSSYHSYVRPTSSRLSPISRQDPKSMIIGVSCSSSMMFEGVMSL